MTAFRPRSLVIGAVGLLALCLGLAVWAVLIEPGRLVVKEVELSLPSWPREMPPLTIAVVADLHTGAPHVGPEKLDRVVTSSTSAGPTSWCCWGTSSCTG